jgi:hypothetical protein
MKLFSEPDVSQEDNQEGKLPVPVEVEIYINSDGSVTFADLEEKTVLIAQSLNPDQPLACQPPGPTADLPAPGHE